MKIKLIILVSVIYLLTGCLTNDNGGHVYNYSENYYSTDTLYSEDYKKINENEIVSPISAPLSTFAADIDTASYSNVRRFINSGKLPTKDAVRIEELINYFTYDYSPPDETDTTPFSVNVEMGKAPWNEKHNLVKIGLKGKIIDIKNFPKSNIVFLIDVSGSMDSENKLTLVKLSLKLLVDKLREDDIVSIVTYSDNIKIELEPTRGNEKEKIKNVIDKLHADGSTNGQQGLKIAYEKAKASFIKEGNNRVILCTDGDFNVGMTSDSELETYITKQKESGIFLSVFGFGYGNLKDSKLETLADKGNGHYAYIDSVAEAIKVFSKQFFGNMVIIAKDVKFQVEFNPDHIKGYRLIGYENRALKPEDFENNDKDGGEIGMGHTLTAVYELIPKTSDEEVYVPKTEFGSYTPNNREEIFSFSINYKKPSSNESTTIKKLYKENDVKKEVNSLDYNFTTSVIEFGLLLRESKYKYNASFNNLINRAKLNKGEDVDGYRAEFIKIAEMAQVLYNDSID